MKFVMPLIRSTALHPAIRGLLRPLVQEIRCLGFPPMRLQHIAVLTQERSGSTFATDLIGSHLDVLADPHDFYSPARLLRRQFWLRFSPTRCRGRCVKMKLTEPIENFNPRVAGVQLNTFVSKGGKIIWLMRSNVVSQAISAARVRGTGVLHNQSGRDRSQAPVRFTVDPRVYLQQLWYYGQLKQFEAQALVGVPHFKLHYETILSSRFAPDQLFTFLGLPFERAESDYTRFADGRRSDCIDNLEGIIELTCSYFNRPYDALWVRRLIDDEIHEAEFFEQFHFHRRDTCAYHDTLAYYRSSGTI